MRKSMFLTILLCSPFSILSHFHALYRTVAVGEQAVDRVACALNGKVIMPIFLPLAQQLLNDGTLQGVYSIFCSQLLVAFIAEQL